MKIIIALIFAILMTSSHADPGDQKLKQALLNLTETTAKLKALSDVVKGREIFEEWCVACHAPEIRQLPVLAESPLMQGSKAELIKFILFSRNGAQHPAWHLALSPYDTASLSNYLQVAFKKDSPTELLTAAMVASVIAQKYQGDNNECAPSKQRGDSKN